MGFLRSRTLFQMRRSLFAALPTPSFPDGVRLRSFLPGEMDSAKQIEDKLAGYDEYLKEQRSVYAAPVGQPPGGPSPGRTIDFNSLPKVRR